MEKVQDYNYYPRPFKSMEVITFDTNGYPTLTRFYSGEQQTGYTMFEWVRENNPDGLVLKWSIQNVNTNV